MLTWGLFLSNLARAMDYFLNSSLDFNWIGDDRY
jgi:hypothetical protein